MTLDSQWVEHVPLMDSQVRNAYVLQSQKLVFGAVKQLLLSANSPQLDVLVGSATAMGGDTTSDLRDGGRRSRGHLDHYYAPEEVDQFLASCAYTLLSEQPSSHTDVTRAIHYYQLAGRTVEVLEEVCRQVAAVLPHTTSPSRTYWIQWSTEYYRHYIDGGHGQVIQNLQSEGQIEVAKTLQGLLHISMIYQLAEQGQVEEACEACHALGYFPSTIAEVPAQLSVLEGLSPPLQVCILYLICV
jgi:hypothetical protein